MTIALDTSALLATAIECPQRATALAALDDDPIWCASAMALTEALPSLDRLVDTAVLRDDIEDHIRRLWDHLHVVPLDQRCLDLAADLARRRPIRLSDAIQLAAADRLPGPVRFITFDPVQIPAALAAGFDVVSTTS